MWKSRARFPPSGEKVGPRLRHFPTTPSKATATPSDSWRDRHGEFRDPERGLQGCDDRRGVPSAWHGTLVPRLLAVPQCIGYTKARRPHSHAPRPQYPPDTCFASRGAGCSAYRGPFVVAPRHVLPCHCNNTFREILALFANPRRATANLDARNGPGFFWCTFRPLWGTLWGHVYIWASKVAGLNLPDGPKTRGVLICRG